MSHRNGWMVSGPSGFRYCTSGAYDGEDNALSAVFRATTMTVPVLMRQAGYRAEPIEEPKMVTVRADLLVRAHNVIDYLDSHNGLAREIRAALDGAK